MKLYCKISFLLKSNYYLDIDECAQGLARCTQNCNNTVGGYFCTCMDGFELESDNHTCTGDDYAKIN